MIETGPVTTNRILVICENGWHLRNIKQVLSGPQYTFLRADESCMGYRASTLILYGEVPMEDMDRWLTRIGPDDQIIRL